MTLANGIQYFAVDGCARQFFRCAALKATLSTDSCTTNWRRAQRLRPDEVTAVHLCRDCPIGAAHAGERHVARSALFGLGICPRCRKYAGRIIHGTRCVSCYNRERELVAGRNAKGTKPTMAPLLPRRVSIVLDGKPVEVVADRAADTPEMMIAVMRVVPGRLIFTRARGGEAISLAEMIRRHRPAPADLLRKRWRRGAAA